MKVAVRLDDLLDAIDLYELSAPIKKRAMESFPTVIRTLDALHLATVILLRDEGEGLALYSYDRSMNLCARALGIEVAF